MKKYLSAILFLLMIFLTTSCGNSPTGVSNASESPPASASAPPDVTQSEMWRVELISAELADSLTATMAAVQYGGGVLETTSEVVPGGGNTFLLLQLKIEKIGAGRASFTWNDAHIEDAAGNVIYRHANDTFLANLNIPRLKGTDIVLGIESGYVCFEIPKGTSGLRFIADEGNISIAVDAE